MANKKEHKTYTPLFGKENYRWMFIGLGLIALGFILMAGGKGSYAPDGFDPSIFNFRRIRLAPALIVAGFLVEVYAILRSPGKKSGR